jgi:DNA-directed RNA polymerase subunit RPC12/RpoP
MQQPPPAHSDKIHRYPCANCGADLLFEPKNGKLTCPYCNYTEEIAATADTIEERAYEAYLKPRAEMMQQIAVDALQVACNSCGAVVTFVPPQTAGRCDFCGTQIVAQPKAADPMVAPEGVLPFVVTSDQATAGLRQWINSRWFAPSALKLFAQPGAIQSVYLPFWTYDTYTVSHYTGQRGEHYWETEYYTETNAQGQSERKSRQVQKTHWYPASGTVERWFDDILVPASKSLPLKRLEALEPWDLPQLKPYDPAYLSGHKAQSYQVLLDEGFERAKQFAAGVIDGDVRQDIGGDVQQVDDVRTQYTAITFKHLLLPVYAGAYRFREKLYQIVINGRTGEIQGDRPYSALKIGCLVLSILGIIIFIVLLASLFGGSR